MLIITTVITVHTKTYALKHNKNELISSWAIFERFFQFNFFLFYTTLKRKG